MCACPESNGRVAIGSLGLCGTLLCLLARHLPGVCSSQAQSVSGLLLVLLLSVKRSTSYGRKEMRRGAEGAAQERPKGNATTA